MSAAAARARGGASTCATTSRSRSRKRRRASRPSSRFRGTRRARAAKARDGSPARSPRPAASCRGPGPGALLPGLPHRGAALPHVRRRGTDQPAPVQGLPGPGTQRKERLLKVTIPRRGGGRQSAPALRRGRGRPVRRPGRRPLRGDPHAAARDLRARRAPICSASCRCTFPQAALGDTVEVPVLRGKAELTVPPGTQPGQQLRLRGKGMPHLRGRGRGRRRVPGGGRGADAPHARQHELLEEFRPVLRGEAGPRLDSLRRPDEEALRHLMALLGAHRSPTSPETTEGLTNFLWEQGALGVVEEETPGDPRAAARLLPPRPASSTASDRRRRPTAPRSRALGFRAGGRARHQPRCSTRQWASAWQQSFPPREVGRAPPDRPPLGADARRRPAADRVVIEPGRAFGTGHHGSTEGCLALLDALAGAGPRRRARARRRHRHRHPRGGRGGARRPARLAIDVDPDAMAAAQKNAAANGWRTASCRPRGPGGAAPYAAPLTWWWRTSSPTRTWRWQPITRGSSRPAAPSSSAACSPARKTRSTRALGRWVHPARAPGPRAGPSTLLVRDGA